MDRHWLLTWTTFGSRLPGDARGSVATVRTAAGSRQRRYLAEAAPGLSASARQLMRGPPVVLTRAHAAIVLADLRSTADYRGWELLAVAVMANHVHVVLGLPGDPDPADLLRVLKAYASRALNRQSRRPVSGTWWTQSGSRRLLREEAAVVQAIRYVQAQRGALVIWGDSPEVRFG